MALKQARRLLSSKREASRQQVPLIWLAKLTSLLLVGFARRRNKTENG